MNSLVLNCVFALGPMAAVCPNLAGLLPATEPRLQAVVEDAADGRLDDHSLLGAALVAAGGTAADEPVEFLAETWRRALQAEPLASDPVHGLPELFRIHRFLHHQILTGDYRDDASSPALAFDGGPYNCVSATFWMVWLARSCPSPAGKLDLRIVEKPGHVCLRLATPSGFVEIEPTCPDWRQAVVARRRPSGAGGQSRVISEAGLLTILLYNRGLDHLEAGDVTAAVALNRLALVADGDSVPARHNLTAAVNARALVDMHAERFAAAGAWFTAAFADGLQEPALTSNAQWTTERWREASALAAARLATIVALRLHPPQLRPHDLIQALMWPAPQDETE